MPLVSRSCSSDIASILSVIPKDAPGRKQRHLMSFSPIIVPSVQFGACSKIMLIVVHRLYIIWGVVPVAGVEDEFIDVFGRISDGEVSSKRGVGLCCGLSAA
jgi:hypothetical protein